MGEEGGRERGRKGVRDAGRGGGGLRAVGEEEGSPAAPPQGGIPKSRRFEVLYFALYFAHTT